MAARKKPTPTDDLIAFPTVRFWQGQLNESGIRNYAKGNIGTKNVYLYRLATFNRWLSGRQFDVREQAVADGRIVRRSVQRSFENVEELLRFGEEGNEKEIKRVMKAYVADPQHRHLKRSTVSGMCSAINSYFDVHDVKIGVRPNGRVRDEVEVTDEPSLELVEFYRIMTACSMDPMTRAVMLVLFQAGLDRSTLADRFNFYAHSQIAKFCGTADHREWRLDACPIPIRLRRVKDRSQVHDLHRARRAGRHQEISGVEGGASRAARSRQRPVYHHQGKADIRGVGFRRVPKDGRLFRTAEAAGPARPQDTAAQDAPPAQEHPHGMRVRGMGGRPRHRARAQGLL